MTGPLFQSGQHLHDHRPNYLLVAHFLFLLQELLNFTSTCHSALDPINLVTSIYRLARMYSDLRHPEVRATWRAELSASPTFAHLLRKYAQ